MPAKVNPILSDAADGPGATLGLVVQASFALTFSMLSGLTPQASM